MQFRESEIRVWNLERMRELGFKFKENERDLDLEIGEKQIRV